MDVYEQIAVKIITSQEAIIGPVAVEQAAGVSGLAVDWPHHQVAIKGNKSDALEKLVGKYADLFGQISIEVSKQSVSSLLSQMPSTSLSLPEILK
jgi:hypothetical protein